MSLMINAIVNLPYERIQPHIVEIMSIIFKRLVCRRTHRFTQGFIVVLFNHKLYRFGIVYASICCSLWIC